MDSNSATLVPTQQSVKAYVDAQVTAQDLDLTTDSGTIAIDLDSETLTLTGGTGVDTSASSNTVTFALDLNELTTETTIADADFIAMVDATDSGSGKITFENLEDAIFSSVSGDVLITEAGVATIQANAVALGTDTTGNYVATIADSGGGGITVANSGSESAAVTLELDIKGLTDDAIASGDFIAFSDEGESGDPANRGQIDDVATLFAGTGLTASSSVISIDAAQTVINSLLATDIKIGEDDQTKIDFEDADKINFYAGNEKQLILEDGALYPGSDNIIDLGKSDNEFKDGFFDGTVTADAFAGPLTGAVTGNADTATLATTVTVTDSTANTNFPVVFHNESNGLLDDTGALRYNPSTGELLVPKLTVAGATTTVDTVTMNAQNAIIFEGATADANETTLSIVDPTADHTQYLINQGGYIPVLAAATTTAITSTPAELNILDDATVTTAELNLIDGGTARGTTAVASGDGILINDGGTMRMTNVDTVSTYFSSHNVGGGNIVTTGALNSGSITSGFGTIDTGSSAITTTGVVSAGGFTIGSAVIAEAELEMIDGISAGTAAASKAVVLDGSKNIATLGTIGSGAITATGSSSFATSIKTPLIEYTDGDDAITIADGGGITAANGITSTAAANSFGATAFSGAVTTNSTIDGIDIATRDGVLTSTTTTANAALPKAGGTMTGNIVMGDDTSIGIADDAERIEFDGAGDISVLGANFGVGTASPSTVLSVISDLDSAELGFNVKHSNLSQGISIGYQRIKAYGTDTNAPIYIDGKGSGDLVLQSVATGKVGIGTASPSQLLHIKGAAPTVFFEDSTNGDLGFIGDSQDFLTTGASADSLGIRSEGDILFGTNGNNTQMSIASTGKLTVSPNISGDYAMFVNQGNSAGWGMRVAAGADNDDYIIRGQNGSGTDKFVVKSGGHVGIGTNAPAAMLFIDQDVNTTAFKIDGENTTTNCLTVEADALTSGTAGYFYSNSGDGTSRKLVQIQNDNHDAADATVCLYILEDGNCDAIQIRATDASYDQTIMHMNAVGRSQSSSFNFLHMYTDGDNDVQHNFKGDGTTQNRTGTFEAADYAEYFESKDGKVIAIGSTVKLDGDKIVACEDGDNPLGVIRPLNTSLVGNSAWANWGSKYLTDDYGSPIMEEYTVTMWIDGKHEDGQSNNDIQYHTDKIPSDVIVPDDAIVKSTEYDGSKLMRKKLNPNYDESKSYIEREKRDEWHIVGLLGQIPITKGQPMASSWVKMKDVSDTVEMWMVK